MFCVVEVEDFVRVEPKLFGLDTHKAVEQQLMETYSNYVDREIGKAIAVIDVLNVEDGTIIPGDGATYYKSTFKLLAWKPELHELVFGVISEITDFGAFVNMGVMQGMIHVSQTMEDFVTVNNTGSLAGKASKKTLSKGDLCLARIVAISYKGAEPKIGLTMRQPGLGKLEWIEAEKKKGVARAVSGAKKKGKGKEGKSKKDKGE